MEEIILRSFNCPKYTFRVVNQLGNELQSMRQHVASVNLLMRDGSSNG